MLAGIIILSPFCGMRFRFQVLVFSHRLLVVAVMVFAKAATDAKSTIRVV
jgi:hypothetical protein